MYQQRRMLFEDPWRKVIELVARIRLIRSWRDQSAGPEPPRRARASAFVCIPRPGEVGARLDDPIWFPALFSRNFFGFRAKNAIIYRYTPAKKQWKKWFPIDARSCSALCTHQQQITTFSPQIKRFSHLMFGYVQMIFVFISLYFSYYFVFVFFSSLCFFLLSAPRLWIVIMEATALGGPLTLKETI